MISHRPLLLCLLSLTQLASAHYNLIDPAPYNPIQCNLPYCRGPCPPIWLSGYSKARYSPEKPFTTWRRGQRVRVEWHRNNHEGGFYRRSLVPVKHMNSHKWHKQLAFEWGCFNQNRFKCGFAKKCGSDMHGRAYGNQMTVPDVYPDGDYVFAMVWFGGIHWTRTRAHFSDYWTCSFVRIKGGRPVAHQYRPKFVPGRNNREGVEKGKCVSTSQWVGECGGHQCVRNPLRTGVPGVFAHGRQPPLVYSRFLANIGKISVAKLGAKEEERRVERQMEKLNRRNKDVDLWQARQIAAAAAKRSSQNRRWKQKPGVAMHNKPKPQKKHYPKQTWTRPQNTPAKKWQQQQHRKKAVVSTHKLQKPKTWRHKRTHNRHNHWKHEQARLRRLRDARRKHEQRKKCGGPIPRAPPGYWGPLYSWSWNRMRKLWFARRTFCHDCPHRC